MTASIAGFILLCDSNGTIRQVVSDGIGLGDRGTSPRSLQDLVDQGSRQKAGAFLATIQTEEAAYGWEMNVALRRGVTLLHFTGAVIGDAGMLVVGTSEQFELWELYDKLMAINNEHVNTLRQFIKQDAMEPHEGEAPFGSAEEIYRELSRVNNELVNTQRELAKRNRELDQARAHFQAIFEQAGMGIVLLDDEGRITRSNPAFRHMLDCELGGVEGGAIVDLIHPEDLDAFRTAHQEVLSGTRERFQAELRLRCRDGGIVWGHATGSYVRSTHHGPGFTCVMIEDITARKRAEERLLYMSTHDMLTGLHNRAFFEEERMRLERGRQWPVSVVAVDLDGLKAINDTQGHAAGDELLKRAAEVLDRSFRAEDTVARIGGDEFAILLPKTDVDAVQNAVQRIQAELDIQNDAQGGNPVEFSIGCSTQHEPGSLHETLQDADARLYAEKRRKRQ